MKITYLAIPGLILGLLTASLAQGADNSPLLDEITIRVLDVDDLANPVFDIALPEIAIEQDKTNANGDDKLNENAVANSGEKVDPDQNAAARAISIPDPGGDFAPVPESILPQNAAGEAAAIAAETAGESAAIAADAAGEGAADAAGSASETAFEAANNASENAQGANENANENARNNPSRSAPGRNKNRR